MPARPDAPLYIMAVVICRLRDEPEGRRVENEYEKSAFRKATPRLLYSEIS